MPWSASPIPPGARAACLAGALLAAAPAQALDARADLPKVAPTMEPCPGRPGFVRLPGGRSCTRLSGRVTGGLDLRADRAGVAAGPAAAGRFAIDNRTDTDLGEVRTYVRIGNGRR